MLLRLSSWGNVVLSSGHSLDFSCLSRLPVSNQVYLLTLGLTAWNTVSGPGVSMASHSYSHAARALLLWPHKQGLVSSGQPYAPSPSRAGAGHMRGLPHSAPRPISPWHCAVLGRARTQTAQSELFSALDPDPPTLSLLCLQPALENDRLPSFFR